MDTHGQNSPKTPGQQNDSRPQSGKDHNLRHVGSATLREVVEEDGPGKETHQSCQDVRGRGQSQRQAPADGDRMKPWPFVAAAYAVAFGATAVLALVSWLAMRRAEK